MLLLYKVGIESDSEDKKKIHLRISSEYFFYSEDSYYGYYENKFIISHQRKFNIIFSKFIKMIIF